jgi:hypothetical protein
MSTYEIKRKDFSRTPIWYVKVTLDFCAETFGASPCVAVGTGDKKCFNTFFTCKDTANYNKTTKVYRFCTNGELPFNDGERPYIQGVTQLPTEIKESLPVLGRVKVKLYDEPDTDVGIDPYVTERTSTQGTFWRKLLKRNPNYKGRPIQVYEGFAGIPESEFQLRFEGKLDNIRFIGKGMVELEGIDTIGDLKRVKLPIAYNVQVSVAANSSVTTMSFKGDDVDKLSGSTAIPISPTTGLTYYLRIGSEIISYASSNYDSTSNQITGITRGVGGSTSKAIAENDDVSFAPHYNGNPFDVMLQLLGNSASAIDTPGAGISTAFINTPKFEFERDFTGLTTEVIVDGWIDEDMDVGKAYFDLVDLMSVKTWVGEDLKINVQRRIPNLPDRTYHKITDDANITLHSDSFDQNEASRFTRGYFLWDYIPASDFKEGKNFKRREALIDLDLESSNAFNEDVLQIDRSRFFRAGVMSEASEKRFIQNRQRRWLYIHQRALPLIDVDLEYKDSNIKTGEYCKVNTDLFVDDLGNPISSAICQVVKREVKDNRVRLRLEKQPDNKTAFIGDSSGGAGSSAFSEATEAQRNYAFIAAADSASSTGAVMDDSSPAYLIY